MPLVSGVRGRSGRRGRGCSSGPSPSDLLFGGPALYYERLLERMDICPDRSQRGTTRMSLPRVSTSPSTPVSAASKRSRGRLLGDVDAAADPRAVHSSPFTRAPRSPGRPRPSAGPRGSRLASAFPSSWHSTNLASAVVVSTTPLAWRGNESCAALSVETTAPHRRTPVAVQAADNAHRH